MNILYTCDDNYVWLMGISMISLFEANKTIVEINVFLLGDAISNENRRALEQIANSYNRMVYIIDVPDLDIPESLCTQRWPKSAYTRLFSGQLVPQEIDKIIYLDCDTIIIDNLEELWDFEISSYTVCGVKDCIGGNYKKNIGMDAKEPYINAGVLLINLSELRKHSIGNEIGEFLKRYSKIMNYSDQDVLNGIFHREIGIIPAKYNVMTLLYIFEYKEILTIRRPNNYYTVSEIDRAKENPILVHFTTCMTSVRPWFKGSEHSYAKEFLKFKEMSPWKNEVLKECKSDSFKDKILKVLLLCTKGIRLPIIGFLHSVIVPFSLKIKSKIL